MDEPQRNKEVDQADMLTRKCSPPRTMGALSLTMVFTIVSVLALCSSEARAEEKLVITNEFEYQYNTVTGPGADRSYLIRGGRYTDKLYFEFNQKKENSEASLRFSLQATNNRNVDPKSIVLTSLEGRFADSRQTTTLGDVYASFSSYSLSGSVKGVSYRYQENPQSPELTAVYGIAYPRWDNFWGGNEQKAIKREVYGVRMKEQISPRLLAGINILHADDSSRTTDSDPLYRTINYAIDWEYSNAGLSLLGESSYASTDESVINWGLPVDKSRKGRAHKVAASIGEGPERLELEFEQVSPDYVSLMGSAVADREKAKVRWKGRLSPDISYRVGSSWYHDKLDETSTASYRTQSSSPEAGLVIQKAFGRPDAFLDISFTENTRKGDTKNDRDAAWTVGYNDVIGRTSLQTSFSYNQSRSTDFGLDVMKNSNATYNVSLSTDFKSGAYNVKPSINWGYFRQQDERIWELQQTYEASLSFDISRPEKSISSNIKAGKKKLLAPSRDDTMQWFAHIGIDWKPPFLAKYHNGKMYVRAFINDYKYDPSRQNNYRETGYVAGVSVGF